jgi:hypothetical protein
MRSLYPPRSGRSVWRVGKVTSRPERHNRGQPANLPTYPTDPTDQTRPLLSPFAFRFRLPSPRAWALRRFQ